MDFKTIRAAKDYLAKRITDQATLEGATLTEVERKMLYFTEDGGLTLAMATVSEEFTATTIRMITKKRSAV